MFCGDLLVHLKDPITRGPADPRASVAGSAIICNPIIEFRLGRGRALVEFDGIDEFQWWLLSEAAMERMMRAVGFSRVEVGPSFELPGDGRRPVEGPARHHARLRLAAGASTRAGGG